MDRAAAAAWVGVRLGSYLSATGRAATDAASTTLAPALGEAIDDALLALGVADADLATVAYDDPAEVEDLKAQLRYRVLLQAVHDLGGSTFNVNTGGSSFALYQLRQSAEKDLAAAEAAVLERFGTIGPVPAAGAGATVPLAIAYLTPASAGHW